MPHKRTTDDRYTASFYVDTKRYWAYGRTRAELARNLAAKREAVARGAIATKAGKQTMTAYLALWLETSVKPPRRTPYTYENYAWVIRRHLVPHIGSIKLAALKPAHIKQLHTALLEKLAPRSVGHVHRVLHSALTDAVKLEILDRNPADHIDLPRVVKKDRPALSQEEARLLLDSTKTDRLHALWVVLLGTALRISEAVGLSWTDLELGAPQPILHVRYALHYTHALGFWLDEPKTARGRRTIELSQRAVSALKRHSARQAEERLLAGPDWIDNGLVFCTPEGSPLPRWCGNDALERACKRAGLRRITAHDLRRTAISHLLSDGMYLRDVSDMAGHANPSITTNAYMMAIRGQRGSAALRMDALLGEEE